MIKWTARPSRFSRSTDWVGQTEFGAIEITRVSHKPLGTPWRMRFPNGNTLPVANADLAKEQAEMWLERERGKRGQRKEQTK